MRHISTGATNKVFAAELLIGRTVKTRAIPIFNKLGVRGRTEAVMETAGRGIIKL